MNYYKTSPSRRLQAGLPKIDADFWFTGER
jgi:hypothetical protein